MNAEFSESKSLEFIPEVTDWTGAVRGMFANRTNALYVEEPVRLFDEKERACTKPPLRAETTYSFYDRSSLEEFARLRRMLQRWVDRLPPVKQKDIVGRMRHQGSGSWREQQNFYGAFFELFLHEFLNGTGGYTVVEPKIGNLTPDFGVTETRQDGTQVHYVVEASDINFEGAKTDWKELRALDILDEIEAPDYHLMVQTKGSLATMPRKRDLMRPFEELVSNANYDDLSAIAELHSSIGDLMPKAEFHHGDWTITGKLFPVPRENHPRKGGFIPLEVSKVRDFREIEQIKKRLYEKAQRYRDVDNLIITLRSDSLGHSLGEALFGHVTYAIDIPKDTSLPPQARRIQAPDGFWFNTEGLLNQNVIGVVEFHELHPRCVGAATAVFYSNPYSTKPLPAWASEVTHADYSDGSVKIVAGKLPCAFVSDHEPFNDFHFRSY